MTPIPNPYNPLRPTVNPDLFVGREEAFAFFRQHLVGVALDHALGLIGRRGLGKSSVLRQLGYQLDERYRVCIVDLGALDLSREDMLVAALADAVRLALEEAGASTYRLPEWPTSDGEEDVQEIDLLGWFFSDYLEVAIAALRLRHLLLALDDAHLLLQAIEQGMLRADVLDHLVGALAQYDRLDLVFALDEAFEDQALNMALLSDPALHFRLTELSREEAEWLVRTPMQGACPFEEGVAEQVLALAGGHPFLLHSVCRLLVRRSEERSQGGPITESDLEVIEAAVLEQSDEVFYPLWRDAAQNERLTLRALVELRRTNPDQPVSFGVLYEWVARAGYTINKTQLAAALRSLDYKGLVHSDADTYVLPADLIAHWVEDNIELEEEPPPPPEIEPVEWRRLVPLAGLVAVLLVVAGLGVASLSGLFDSDGGSREDNSDITTATLALDIEGTQQANFTLTAAASLTPSLTSTPSLDMTGTAGVPITQTITSLMQTMEALASARPSPTIATPVHTPRPPTLTPEE